MDATTGRSGSALTAVTMAVATLAAASPDCTPTLTRWPAMYSETVPAAVAVPTTAMVAVATAAAGSSTSGRHHTLHEPASWRRYTATMRASIDPRPRSWTANCGSVTRIGLFGGAVPAGNIWPMSSVFRGCVPTFAWDESISA
jgi:hypothetical protein